MLSCAQHDYLELSCMHGYQLTITAVSGELVTGIAKDICYVEGLQCLVLEQKMRDVYVSVSVAIADIAALTALTANPYFSTLIIE